MLTRDVQESKTCTDCTVFGSQVHWYTDCTVLCSVYRNLWIWGAFFPCFFCSPLSTDYPRPTPIALTTRHSVVSSLLLKPIHRHHFSLLPRCVFRRRLAPSYRPNYRTVPLHVALPQRPPPLLCRLNSRSTSVCVALPLCLPPSPVPSAIASPLNPPTTTLHHLSLVFRRPFQRLLGWRGANVGFFDELVTHLQLYFKLFSEELPSIEEYRAYFERAQHSSCDIDRALRDIRLPHSYFFDQNLFTANALVISNPSMIQLGQIFCSAVCTRCLRWRNSVWVYCPLRKLLNFNCKVCRQSGVAHKVASKLSFFTILMRSPKKVWKTCMKCMEHIQWSLTDCNCPLSVSCGAKHLTKPAVLSPRRKQQWSGDEIARMNLWE